ncbi:hypothetical protein KDA_45850 [Dictyobacter alpinus]|uniref:HTH deoR-type domain-containing protein n=1 Tax=Dictyobacter alpinus TaxID=2014873 RepID=A0A402BCG5_9CHLR|nr:HTH domain-containing protein [Dictyobacter alpinus]GCE29101.1 hypothetical protein KDA_45850 [Dictyobacter alpinus]
MRADRLLSLLLLLQNRGRMTARALAEQLEVSERTIYRDIEALSFAGIPLYTERGPGGGCELLDGYQTRLTGLTTPEVRALFLLGTSTPLADLGLGQALENALLKLSAALPAASRANARQVRQRIHMDTTQPTPSRPISSNLELIQQAIWHDYTLRLRLTGNGHHKLIDPYGLVSQHGNWYLVGASAGMMQVIRVTSIQTTELTDQPFSCPTEFNLATYWAEHVSMTTHSTANGRLLKKAKMPVALPTYTPPSRGVQHTVLAHNKKKNFCSAHVLTSLLILPPSPKDQCVCA